MCSITSTSQHGSISSSGSNGVQRQGQTSDKRNNNENNQNNINTVLQRTSKNFNVNFCFKIYLIFKYFFPAYDLATQCESRHRSSMRRHTIVGCSKSNFSVSSDSKSLPASRPDSRQRVETSVSLPPAAAAPVPTESEVKSSSDAVDKVPETQETIWTNSLDELQWKETLNATDKLSLTLDEIIHIRSVMTKAELEGLPVGIKIKEEVERRKLCFLCLRTRFSLFGQRGVNCKLCDRTVCIKCFTKVSFFFRGKKTFFFYEKYVFRCESHVNTSDMYPLFSSLHQF